MSRLVAALALCLSAVRAFNVPLSTSVSWLAHNPSATSARTMLGARPAWTTLRAQIDSAPEGPGLSGWATNPAVKAVESGRTVSLPGYYKDDEKMLPQWAQEFIPGKVEETDVVLTESASSLAVRITNEEMSWEPFYCRLVGEGGAKNAADMAIRLDPIQGEMAPRGKQGERVRTDASDPKGNYKDEAVIRLELTREGLGYLSHVRGGGKDELAEKPLYLVVKTEQKTTTWRVLLKP